MKVKMVNRVERWEVKSEPKLPVFYLHLITYLVQNFFSNHFHFLQNRWILHFQCVFNVLFSHYKQMLNCRGLIDICNHECTGSQLLKVPLQKMQLAGSVGGRSPNIITFNLPSISQIQLQQLSKYLRSQHCMEGEKIVIREEIKQMPQNYGQISITVEEPIKVESQTFAYFSYSVAGSDMHGPFIVRRRYKDFDLLRRRLAQRWLGIYIPPISGKRSESNFLHVFKMFGNNDARAQAKYAETRKRFLRYFCQGIAIRPYLFYCDLFQKFLRGGQDFQLAIQGCLEKQYSFILLEYENNFKSITQLTAEMDYNAVLAVNEGHLTEFKANQQNLNKIYEAIYRNVHARDEFNHQFNVCMETALPEYQEKFLLNHVGNDRTKLILQKVEGFNTKLAEYKLIAEANPTELFLQLVAYQIRQTKSFIQAIEGRKSAEKKRDDLKDRINSKQKEIDTLSSGGFSFKSVFRAGSKELQIKEMQMKMEILKNQLYCIEKMIVIMVANTNYEIQQFKLRRGKEYGELFKNVAEKEFVQLQLYTQLLNSTVK